jgi:hypothetical protein
MTSFRSTPLEKIRAAIEAIEPSRVSEFLVTQGWTRASAWREKGYDWITESQEHVLVPTDRTLRHYAETMAGIFEMFVAEEILFEDVLAIASFGSSDIIRRRIDDPATASGSCLLADARSEIAGMKDLLWWSSRRYATKAGTGNKLALSYLDQCRAGQTEFGSYVLKVYTPVSVAGGGPENRSFGRHATMAAAQNVSFLADDDYNPERPLPAELDWHVAESIVRMKSSAGMWSQASEMSVKYVKNVQATADQASPAEDHITVPMKSIVFERAEAVYEALRKGELFERLVFNGHITDLHKDLPGSKKQERRITIRTQINGTNRNVTMRLMPTDYSRAVAWHDSERLIQVDAKIDKRWRVWTAVEYYTIASLEPADEGPADLFQRP